LNAAGGADGTDGAGGADGADGAEEQPGSARIAAGVLSPVEPYSYQT